MASGCFFVIDRKLRKWYNQYKYLYLLVDSRLYAFDKLTVSFKTWIDEETVVDMGFDMSAFRLDGQAARPAASDPAAFLADTGKLP